MLDSLYKVEVANENTQALKVAYVEHIIGEIINALCHRADASSLDLIDFLRWIDAMLKGLRNLIKQPDNKINSSFEVDIQGEMGHFFRILMEKYQAVVQNELAIPSYLEVPLKVLKDLIDFLTPVADNVIINASSGFAVGNSDFKSIIEGKLRFIDKSLLIKDVIDDAAQVKLIIRPRRFGKTLNMKMLEAFFSITEGAGNVFTSLKIWGAGDYYRQQQGQYPVIFLTLKDIKGIKFKDVYQKIEVEISELYKKHKAELLDYLVANVDEYKFYQAIIDEEADRSRLEISLKKLSELLFKRYKKKVIILIDEYDNPCNFSYSSEYYHDMIDFMSKFLSATLKDNEYLYQAILTGIFRIAKEGIFSGVNNLSIYSMVVERYGAHFGFLPEEIAALVEVRGQQNILQGMREWYGGYRVGRYEVYNPWSVIQFINNYRIQTLSFQPYWIDSADNKLIYSLVNEASFKVLQDCKKLAHCQKLIKAIDVRVALEELHKNEELLWGFLLFSGYIAAKPPGEELEKKTGIYHKVKLFLPNRELHQFFSELLHDLLKDKQTQFIFRKNFEYRISLQEKMNTLSSYLNLIDLYLMTDTESEACIKAAECCGMAMALANSLEESKEKEAVIAGIIKKIVATIKEKFIYSGTQISSGIQAQYFEQQLHQVHTGLATLRLTAASVYEKHSQDLQKYHQKQTNKLVKLFKDICQFSFDMMGFNYGEQTEGIALILLGSLATKQATPVSGIEYILLLSEEKKASENHARYLALAKLIEVIVMSLGETPVLHCKDILQAKNLYFPIVKGFSITVSQKPSANNDMLSLVNTMRYFTGVEALKLFSQSNQLSSLLLMPRFLMGDGGLFEAYRDRLRQAIQGSREHQEFIRKLINYNLGQQKHFITGIKKDLQQQRMDRVIDIKLVSLYHIHFAYELVGLMVASGTLDKWPNSDSFWDVFEALKPHLDEKIYESWYGFVVRLLKLIDEIILEGIQRSSQPALMLPFEELGKRLQISDWTALLKSLTQIHSALIKLHDQTNQRFTRALMNSPSEILPQALSAGKLDTLSHLSIPKEIKTKYEYMPGIEQRYLVVEVESPDLSPEWESLILELMGINQKEGYSLDNYQKALLLKLLEDTPGIQSDREIVSRALLEQRRIIVRFLYNQDRKEKAIREEALLSAGFSTEILQLDANLLKDLISLSEEVLLKEESTTIVQNYLREVSQDLERINKLLANKFPGLREAGIKKIQAHLNMLQGCLATVESCATPTNKEPAMGLLKSLALHYEALLEPPKSKASQNDEQDIIEREQALAKDQQALVKNDQYLALLNNIKSYNANEGQLIYIAHAWNDGTIRGVVERERWVGEFLMLLYRDLKMLGFIVLLDTVDVQVGDDRIKFMQEHIPNSDYVLLIGTEPLSKPSQPESDELIKTELSLIRAKWLSDLKRKSHRVIPIILTGTLITSLPLEFRGLDIMARIWSSSGYLKSLKALFEKLGEVARDNESYKACWSNFESIWKEKEEIGKSGSLSQMLFRAQKTSPRHSIERPLNLSLLEGYLPERQMPIYFLEEKVLGDGNCGFTTLGANRQQVAETLLTLENNPSMRESLSEEIREALMTEQFQTERNQQLLEALYQQQGRENEELIRIRDQFKEMPHFADDTLGNSINWLNEQCAPEEGKRLQQLSSQTFEAEDALLLYCKSPEAFRAYLLELADNQNLWLGYKSALLYAKVKGITLYIWTKSDKDSSRLVLQDHVLGECGQIIHMLSTGAYTHFNLLVEELRLEEKVEDAPSITPTLRN